SAHARTDRMLRGTVDRVRFRGASLEGNALGDPVERELIVYLPASYDGARRYPVVMVLAGFAGTNSSLVGFKPWEPNLLERYERLLYPTHPEATEGALRQPSQVACGEAILVLPDCFTRLGGSQYLDSPAQGNYQRYLADDVLSLVDKRYCTLPQRESRAIIGKSSGGFGALRMGIDRPECFSVIGSHAGDCAFELCIRPRFAESAAVYERHGGSGGFLRHIEACGGPRSQPEFHALELLALAHAYAPVLSSERPTDCLGELPFDPYTAQIIPEKWARWLAHDPAVCNIDALAQARLVFLDAGKSDEYGLQFGARILSERLIVSGVAVQHEEFDGGHMGTAYRYDVSLPKIIAALEVDSRTHQNTQLLSETLLARAAILRETRGSP
ncbi:MAG: putative esterase, partial [Myxococcaceae bacterium]|nr:putative esterase [Myxococcaceae bacterium]